MGAVRRNCREVWHEPGIAPLVWSYTKRLNYSKEHFSAKGSL